MLSGREGEAQSYPRGAAVSRSRMREWARRAETTARASVARRTTTALATSTLSEMRSALAREGQQAKTIQSPFFEKKKTAPFLKKKRTKCAYEKPTKRGSFSERSQRVRRAPRARVSRVYVHLALKKLPRVRLERARLRVRARIGAGSKRERFAWLRARTTFQSGDCTLGLYIFETRLARRRRKAYVPSFLFLRAAIRAHRTLTASATLAGFLQMQS